MNRHERRKQAATALVNQAPITTENPAVAAHITYAFAEDLRKKGQHDLASIAKVAADSMTLEVGRLPPGTQIPEEVWREVYAMVSNCFQRCMLGLQSTPGRA